MGRAKGAELLIRWHHPSRGLVAPSDFIPLAEELQLIKDIGRWVIEEACQQLAQWQNDEAKKHLILAINISAVQFQDDHFVSDLLQIVKIGNKSTKIKS
ncbi:MAG: EAL domain-containing protein [Gammaproteobacteria bacterium]|nr:EAL domain-containing protein [Gammaproteobacteria bacterium]